MSADHWIAIGTWVAVGVAVYAAVLAKQASDTWRKSIKLQRFDDAIMAALELRSKAYRIEALMEVRADKKDVSDAYTDAWLRCNRFEQTYLVAEHYSQSQSLEDHFPDELKRLLNQIRKDASKPLRPFPKVFDYLLDQLRPRIINYNQSVGISDQDALHDRVKQINDLAEGAAEVLRDVLIKEQVIEK